jgi:phosphonate transport system substrate-binding protein
MKKIALCLLALLSFPCSSAAAEGYFLSMPPLFSAEQMNVMLKPLATRLSEETGNTIEVFLAKNIDQYSAEVLHGTIVIGYETPVVYVNISNVHEAIASAVATQQDALPRGIIITRPESGISGLGDLKGKKIMIASRISTGGFLSQKLTLQENGIDVEHDCQLTEATNYQEENVLISVSIGDVDAGFISEHALHKADQYIAPGSITVIATTAPLPNWVVSVTRTMPQVQKDELKKALLSLSAEDPVSKALGISGFTSASDADYDIIRDIIE